MNFLKRLFSKQRSASAHTLSVSKKVTTTNETVEQTAEAINQNLLVALAYSAKIQGVTFEQEDLDYIMEAVNRSVCKVKGLPVPGAEEEETKRSSKTKEDDGAAYRKMLHKLETYMVRFALRFNELTGNTEIGYRVDDEDEPTTELVYAPVSDRDVCSMVQDVRCEGLDCWNLDIKRFLGSNKVKGYHPFLQYFKTLPEWDGVDRVTPLAQRVSSGAMWVNGFHRWMLGVTAQWMGYGRRKKGRAALRANSVAPILISEQQGWGKSTFCRMLVPEELQDYYTDSFDIKQSAVCETKLATYGLINIDEFDQISPSRNAQLKNLMQMATLHVRKAHQSVTRNRFRLASFIGTSNSRDLLTDKSGSRRFLCVELDRPIDCETPVEYEQLYAQLKQEVLRGERYWFNDAEEAEIQESNAVYYKTVTEEEIFRKLYVEADKKAEGAIFLSADDIYKEMREKFPIPTVGLKARDLAKLLPTFAKRERTSRRNGYWVIRKNPQV
jgi:hypothetical protein